MMGCRGSFGTFHEGNVDGGVGGRGGAVVKHGDLTEGTLVLLVETLHPWRTGRKEELLQSVGQSRARLTLTELCRSGGEMVLAGRGPVRGFTL